MTSVARADSTAFSAVNNTVAVAISKAVAEVRLDFCHGFTYKWHLITASPVLTGPASGLFDFVYALQLLIYFFVQVQAGGSATASANAAAQSISTAVATAVASTSASVTSTGADHVPGLLAVSS